MRSVREEVSSTETVPARSSVPVSLEFVLAVTLLAANAWLAFGAFESIARDRRPVEYVLVSAPFTTLVGCAAAAACLLLILQVIVRQRSEGPAGTLFTSQSTYHLRPLRWLACSLVPLLALLLPFASRLAPLWYVLFDLRWYWWPVVAFEVLRRLDVTAPTLGSSRSRTTAMVATLALVPLGIGVLFTPHLRFSGVLHGDEPKYVRFCENFYQGLGFDISRKRPLAEASRPAYPRIGDNFRHLLRAVPEELALLADDARRIVIGSDQPRLVAPDSGGALFFVGKHPGTMYQLHSPGVSFLLFPAYVLDRTLTGSGIGYHREFPAKMPAVHVVLMTLFAGYVLALFRLLHTYSGSRFHAGMLAILGGVTLPAGAFVFQIYPEVAAGLVLFVLVRAVIGETPSTPRAAVGYGLLTGCLPWIHIRFAPAAAVIIAAMLLRRREWRQQVGFVVGTAIPLLLLSLYAYRLTGSLLPMATYGSEAPLWMNRLLRGVPAFAFDRAWGLLPHTPLYLLSVPGLVLAWRHRRRAAFVILIVIAAVVLPAAGHAFWAAWTTPGRYIVPVAPLLLVFVAEVTTRWSRQRTITATFVVLAIVSVETAVRYNLHHIKNVGPLVAREFSGWRVNLLFPSMGTGAWSTDAAVGVAIWSALLAVVAAVTWLWSRPGHRALPPLRSGQIVTDSMAGLFALAAIGIASSVALRAFDPSYMRPAQRARERVLSTFAGLPKCALCYSSASGAVPPTVALGNEFGLIDIRVVRPPARAGRPVRIRVRPRTPKGEFVVGDVRVELGDGRVVLQSRVFGDLEVTHVYAAPGGYTVRASVQGPSEQPLEASLRLEVVE